MGGGLREQLMTEQNLGKGPLELVTGTTTATAIVAARGRRRLELVMEESRWPGGGLPRWGDFGGRDWSCWIR